MRCDIYNQLPMSVEEIARVQLQVCLHIRNTGDYTCIDTVTNILKQLITRNLPGGNEIKQWQIRGLVNASVTPTHLCLCWLFVWFFSAATGGWTLTSNVCLTNCTLLLRLLARIWGCLLSFLHVHLTIWGHLWFWGYVLGRINAGGFSLFLAATRTDTLVLWRLFAIWWVTFFTVQVT